ncbi:protease PrsW [Xylanibacillus composti]|uniref:Protease PrsW n=1 Tax=Xylanibacillus composti TaxID=1572762 RepID=A0A8J4H701_9BACL|nr:glutamic-type intramembrane protease PrsW [Xylanibacillus composti]MDT9725434.1 protease PrsW [Xylanibacillus composti]GIQ71051.1 protease PrsW [Xylanibacillus composti]
MTLLSILMGAVAPGISLLTYIYLKDRYSPEPIRLVARMFIVGMLVVFPIMVVQRGLVLGLGTNELLFAFGISAALEEFVKWLIVYHMIFRAKEFDEPYDGIVYAVAASLGFATLENILYVSMATATFSEMLMRALLPVSGHALFGVVMGYYLGLAKFGRKPKRMLGLSLLLPLLWHGAYDYIILAADQAWIWFIIPFMAVLWIRSLRKMNRASNRSPLRPLILEEKRKYEG